MRLVIIDDQTEVLRDIIEMIKPEIAEIEIIGIHFNKDGIGAPDSVGDIKHIVGTKEDLLSLCINDMEREENDRYLLDISLFENNIPNITIRFSEYASVTLAKQLMENGVDKNQILFYTHPEGFSALDFAKETKLWGKPLYRPRFEADEVDAKKQFIRKIKEHCNV